MRALTRLFFLSLTFHLGLCRLTQSDGYNIGVVLGSIIGALLVIGIAGAIFYFFCIRRWLGIGEPPELGYARQNDYNLKKQTSSRPINNFGIGIQGKAPPYSGGGGQRQAPASDPYVNGRPQQHFVGSAPRYDGPDGKQAPVVLSTGDHRNSSHSHSHQSPNQSYSSEELRTAAIAGQAYQVSTSRTFQTRTYTGQATTTGGNGSPVSAAYLGTGV